MKLQMLELTVADEQTQPQSEAETNGHSSTTKKTKPGKVSHFLTETKVKRKHVSRLGEWWKSRQVQYPLMFQVVNPRIANVAYLRHAEVCAKCSCRIFVTK